MKVVCVIPAFNEEKTVGVVVKQAMKYCDLVIVVDDGSVDSTPLVAEKAGAMVSKNYANRGLGYSIKKAYALALNAGADVVVQIDADGQYNCDEIPSLLQPIVDNVADLVLGSRFKGEIEEMPSGKVVGNLIGTIVTSFVSGFGCSDAQTGFRAMRRQLLEEISPQSKYTYVQEMIIRSSKEGFRIVEVPVSFAKRSHGNSRLISSLFAYAKRASIIVLQMVIDYHPLLFFSSIGLVFILLGLIVGGYLLWLFFVHGRIDRTPSVILTALLIITGLNMIFFGLLADRIKALKKEIRDEIKWMKRN